MLPNDLLVVITSYSIHYTKLYDHDPLFLYANKFVADESVALDIVQDVFTLVWEKERQLLDDEHLKAYLFNAVRNQSFNYP